MKTRSWVRKPIVLGGVLLVAAALLSTAGARTAASGAPRVLLAAQPVVRTTATMTDATVKGCDVLLNAPVGHDCLLPWPNDAFTVPSSTPTGRRLKISSRSDPANVHGVHVDTTAQNQADGFSPGSVIMTYVSGLSIAGSNIATSTNIGQSLAPDAPIVILDTETHTLVPYFAELDRADLEHLRTAAPHPSRPSPDRRASLRGGTSQLG